MQFPQLEPACTSTFGNGGSFMTYNLTIKQMPTYLHAIITGQNTKENVAQYLENILHECFKVNCFNLLIEERLEGPRLDTLDVFEIASDGAGKARGKLGKIAYVDVCAEGDFMKFAENVAFNRGLRVSVFRTVAEAENWLLNTDRAGTEPPATAGTGKQHL
jgi:hypothetical protein